MQCYLTGVQYAFKNTDIILHPETVFWLRVLSSVMKYTVSCLQKSKKLELQLPVVNQTHIDTLVCIY